VHAIRLALWGYGPAKPAEALRAEIDETLAEAPAHPLALQLLATFPGEDPVRLARSSIAAHPDDGRAWTFLGLALQGGLLAKEREGAYRRAVELGPDNPAALHDLATELAAQGRPGEALPVARRAARLAPWSPPLLAGYAAILSELGRCADALPVVARALDVLPDRAPEVSRRELEAKRAAYAAQCAR
jgi:cytochrome c-type biogenesis protein CcmH/NrfG